MIVTLENAVKMTHRELGATIREDQFYNVKFAKETKQMLGCDIHISSMVWEVYRKHPEIPLSDVVYIDPMDCFTDKLMRKMFFAIIQPTMYRKDIKKEDVWRSCYEAYNELYNFAVSDLLPYIDSIDSFALMDIMDDPDI